MKTRLLSVLLVFLFVTSVTVPAVSAEPAQLVPAVAAACPEVTTLVMGGVAFVVSGLHAQQIAENLGMVWDSTMKGWDNLMKSTGAALDNLIHAKRWVGITTGEGQALMNAVYDCYTATSGGGGKKDGKWYFEARLNHGKIEINTNRMDETQAVKEMGRGKDIMTLTPRLTRELVGKFRGLSEEAARALRFEGDHNPASGYFQHLHYEAHNMRLHCWSWK